MKALTQKIIRKIATIFAIVFALFMVTACGNIAGTTMPANNAQQPTVQQPSSKAHSTVSNTTYSTNVQPEIIVDKPN